MGALLTRLIARPFGRRVAAPADIVTESRIAERVLSDLDAVNELGDQVPFNCPGCGGVLWEMAEGDLRYRCHTGHSFTAPVLLAEQTAKIEETLWVALRMFEERRNLLMTMASTKRRGATVPSAAERARESMVHIRRIRTMLTSGDKATEDAWGHAAARHVHARPATARTPRKRPAKTASGAKAASGKAPRAAAPLKAAAGKAAKASAKA
jgi:two-component system chemotaxis response regulator CheB